MTEKQFCETCEHQLIPIDAALPEVMVQIGGLYVGREQMITGKYYHNRLWVQNGSGEGCFIPLPKVEKLISEEFSTHRRLW